MSKEAFVIVGLVLWGVMMHSIPNNFLRLGRKVGFELFVALPWLALFGTLIMWERLLPNLISVAAGLALAMLALGAAWSFFWRSDVDFFKIILRKAKGD